MMGQPNPQVPVEGPPAIPAPGLSPQMVDNGPPQSPTPITDMVQRIVRGELDPQSPEVLTAFPMFAAALATVRRANP